MKVIKKEVQVHMLPTEEASQIHYVTSDSTNYSQGLNFIDIPRNSSNHTKSKPQHLYFTSNEEIKDGDWVYDIFEKIVFQFKYFDSEILHSNNHSQAENFCRKIIASTDPKLTDLQPKSVLFQDFLPKPSDSFIEDYCKQSGIDKVLVEYEHNCTRKSVGMHEDFNEECNDNCYTSKVNPTDNTITIHKITMTDKEFLRNVCPNHTDKSKWNKNELLHILKCYKEQLQLNNVK